MSRRFAALLLAVVFASAAALYFALDDIGERDDGDEPLEEPEAAAA